MGRKKAWLCTYAAMAVWVVAAPCAFGQVGAGQPLNRPSQDSPSIRLDLIGGRYTRESQVEMGGVKDVSDLNRRWGIPTAGRSPVSDAPVLAPMRLGMIPAPYRRSLLLAGSLAEWQMEEASGFAWATALETPLAGWNVDSEAPITRLPRMEQPADRTDLQRFFDLKPAPPPVNNSAAVSKYRLSTAVEERTQERLARDLQLGFQLFADATGTTDEAERNEKLQRSMWLLGKVRDMKSDAYLPCLLMCHGMIHRGQHQEAILNLINAARRNPSAFGDLPQLARFFGDFDEKTGRSAFLDAQARSLAAVVSAGTATVDGAVFEAYCARLLGDNRRAALALTKAEESLRTGAGGNERVKVLITALRYGL